MGAGMDLAAELTKGLLEEGAARGFAVGSELESAAVEQQEAVQAAVQETVNKAEEAPVVVAVEVELDPEIPEDIQALLVDDDDDEPYVPEINAEAPEDDEWVSPQDVAKLKAEMEKLRKKAAFADQQRLEASKPKWMKEAEKFFPLSEPGSIEASTRKEFLRKAQEQHEALKPAVAKLKAQMEAQLAGERERIAAEEKAKAEAAWGKPLAGPGVVPIEAGDKEAALKRARSKGNLEEVVGVLLGNR